jgi:hypothetical protein
MHVNGRLHWIVMAAAFAAITVGSSTSRVAARTTYIGADHITKWEPLDTGVLCPPDARTCR